MFNKFMIESPDKSNLDPNFNKIEFDYNKYKKLYLTDDKIFYYIKKDKMLSKWFLEKNKEKIRMAYKGVFFIDIINDEIAGYGIDICHLISPIYIMKEYRGKGLGEEILKELIYNLGSKNLEVYEDNQIARHLYKKYGFKEYYKYFDGNEKTNLIFMSTNWLQKLSIKNDFKGVKNIVNSLTREEFNHICKHQEYINSPYILYRNVLYNGNDPACFIEIYKFPKDDFGTVVFACKEKFRRMGLLSWLLFLTTNIVYYEKKIKYLVFKIDKDNKASLNLIQKISYQYGMKNITMPSDDQFIFKAKIE